MEIELTPREKAQELVNEMKHEIEFNCQPSTVTMVAKKCALKLIPHIKEELMYHRDAAFTDEGHYDFQCRLDFYEKVEGEIKNI